MTEQEAAIKIVNLDNKVANLKEKIDSHEKQLADLTALTNTINKLAINIEYMYKEQQAQGTRLTKLENEPNENAQYYKRIVISSIITAILGAVLGAVIALII